MITFINGKNAFVQSHFGRHQNQFQKTRCVYALVGVLGCGETTLLHMIAGFDWLSGVSTLKRHADLFVNYSNR